MSDTKDPSGSPAEPAPRPTTPDVAGDPSGATPAERPPRWSGRWAWLAVIGVLLLAGVLLALADIALYSPWLGPFSAAMVGPVLSTPSPGHILNYQRFDRSRGDLWLTFRSPFGELRPVSPLQALRALLSNGAGLVFLALIVLLVLPGRARSAVERLEDQHGMEIALAGGVATLLLLLAAVLLLRFTLIFLALVPILLVVALATTLFGVACVSLALGRILMRRLRLAAVHPMVVALAGALIVFDLAVIPYVGILVLAAIAVAGLGLAVVTRFGSDSGWSFTDLNW